MEIVGERTIEQDGGLPTLVVIDVACSHEAAAAQGTNPVVGQTMISQLISVLAFLKPFYAPQDNVWLDINLCSTTGVYPSWWCERVVFVARQHVRFPVPVYITQNTEPAQECYMASNRALGKFRIRFGRDGGGGDAGGCGDGGDPRDDGDDGYDYEKILKLTIVEFARRHGIDEPVLERLVQEYHSLEELLGAVLCKEEG